MTPLDPDPPRSAFELPLETATARMAALLGETDRHRAVGRPTGPIHVLRAGIGHGLIALGSVIAPPTTGPTAAERQRTAVSR